MKSPMKRTLALTVALGGMPALAATLPIPAPNPAAQNTLRTAASDNATGGYDASVAGLTSAAYLAAAATAQDISNQDAAQGYTFYYGDAWPQAAAEAQSVADVQSALALAQDNLAQQGNTQENTGYSNETNAVSGVQQANDNAVQSSVGSSTASSMGSITSSTGVQQGQVSMINDTGYLAAGVGTQVLMNGLSTDGYAANDAAIQAAENAASCGNPYCAAAWMAVNAVQQVRADADYAGNVAAAPVLGTALDDAALSSAISDASQQMQQIGAMTGVVQGQSAGETTTAQAMQDTSTGTGVAQNQTAGMVSTDTSYTGAADGSQSTLNSESQQNQNDGWTAAQAWAAGLDAQYAQQAAQTIRQYDLSMAGQGGFLGGSAWNQAAQIAQTAASQRAGITGQQQAIQNTATSDENSTYTQANTIAPSIGATLNSAAVNAASSDAQTTIQQIGNATGVAQ